MSTFWRWSLVAGDLFSNVLLVFSGLQHSSALINFHVLPKYSRKNQNIIHIMEFIAYCSMTCCASAFGMPDTDRQTCAVADSQKSFSAERASQEDAVGCGVLIGGRDAYGGVWSSVFGGFAHGGV